MPKTNNTNLKVIRVGTYRMFFILASVAGLLFFGASQNLIVLSVALGVLFGWVIFELNVILQAVLGVQKILMFVLQPTGENVKVQKSMEMKQPDIKLIDINSGKADETKTPQS